ncbi:MAG: hypothetical protein ACRDV0_02390 [Acidimicrobiales bacterium]
MSQVVVGWRQRARGNVTGAMVLWALVMAVVIFLDESRWASTWNATWAGVGAVVVFGLYLGWRRRAAAVLVAPFVSWFFAWPLLWAAAMIHDGVVKGFFIGLFLVTVGWLGIGLAEVVGLGVVAFTVRWARGSGRSGPDVVIIQPPR